MNLSSCLLLTELSACRMNYNAAMTDPASLPDLHFQSLHDSRHGLRHRFQLLSKQ